MNYKKERKLRLRERRALLDRIGELSTSLRDVTNAYERLAVVGPTHVSRVAFEQTVNVVSRALLDAVDELGTTYNKPAPPRTALPQ